MNLPYKIDSSIHGNLNSLASELFVVQQRSFLHETGFPRYKIFVSFFIDRKNTFRRNVIKSWINIVEIIAEIIESSPKINRKIAEILICLQ